MSDDKRTAANKRIIAELENDMCVAANLGFLIGEAAMTAKGREGDGWRRLLLLAKRKEQ